MRIFIKIILINLSMFFAFAHAAEKGCFEEIELKYRLDPYLQLEDSYTDWQEAKLYIILPKFSSNCFLLKYHDLPVHRLDNNIIRFLLIDPQYPNEAVSIDFDLDLIQNKTSLANFIFYRELDPKSLNNKSFLGDYKEYTINENFSKINADLLRITIEHFGGSSEYISPNLNYRFDISEDITYCLKNSNSPCMQMLYEWDEGDIISKEKVNIPIEELKGKVFYPDEFCELQLKKYPTAQIFDCIDFESKEEVPEP